MELNTERPGRGAPSTPGPPPSCHEHSIVMALAEAGARRPRRSGSGLRFSSCAAGSLFGERSAATQPEPEAAHQLVVVARALAATGTGSDRPRLAL